MKRLLSAMMLALCCTVASAQTAPLAPINFPLFRAFDSNGKPLVGGKLFTYAAGTTTPQLTYTDASGVTPNPNPVILDATGSARVFLSGATYKFVLQNSFGVQQWSADNIIGTAPASIILSPTGTQTVTQPPGTTLNVNNLNSVAYVIGDGVNSTSAGVQAAVTACSGACTIVLVNVVIGSTITIPTTIDVTFQAVGQVQITTTASAFLRDMSAAGARVAAMMNFSGITFQKNNAGIIIQDHLWFSSSTNSGITVRGCHFLTNNAGAIDIAISGDSMNVISDNVFDSGSGLLGTAIETITDASGGDLTFRTPMITTIANNTFRYGTAFTQVALNANADKGEGFLFTGNHFIVSTVKASGLEMDFVANEFVNASMQLVDTFSSVFTGNYLDVGSTAGVTLLILDNVVHQQVTSNTFTASGKDNMTGILFTNPRALSTGTTTVTLSGNTYVGDGPTVNGGSGILFNDIAARNVYVGQENFRSLFTALNFAATLDRSTIDTFEARDVINYAVGLPAHAGVYLVTDHLYKVFSVHVTGLAQASVALTLASVPVYYPTMFPGEVVTSSQRAGESCSANTSFTLQTSAQGARWVQITTTGAVAAGTVACDVTITVNGTVYVGPR